MKRIGILETGAPPRSLQPEFGTYGAMFEQLLGDGFATRVFHVEHMELPERPEDCDGYLITGSPAGVYDDLPWIEPLKRFLREAKGKVPLVGVCFGHQIMAEAFGGRVAKSDKGWGLGLHDYDVRMPMPWMGEAPPRIAVPVSHQDQVTIPPPAARVVAGSDFTPFGMLAYEDQPAISMQCHPEFDPQFVAALLDRQRAMLGDKAVTAAQATLERPNDRATVTAWIRRFFERA